MSDFDKPIVDNDVHYEIEKPKDTWAKMAVIAERLGVEPVAGMGKGISFTLLDGRTYQLEDVLEAFLDRMDEATQ